MCDGKAECRDGSDELNCEQRECGENDFKCGNGVCVPKLWRCDRQYDCKDGSDERYCVYPTSSTTTSTTTTTTTTSTTTTTTPAPTVMSSSALSGADSAGGEPASISLAGGRPPVDQEEPVIMVNTSSSYSTEAAEQQGGQQRFELQLGGDVARIIQHESASEQLSATNSSHREPDRSPVLPAQKQTQTQTPIATTTTSSTTPAPTPVSSSALQAIAISDQLMAMQANKFDYELLPSASNSVQTGEGVQVHSMQSQQSPAHQQRGSSKFMGEPGAQPEAAQPSEQHLLAPEHRQQLPAASQNRVPIYRSLFKSLKQVGHQAAPMHLRQQQQQHGGDHMPVRVVARRRRDRVQASGAGHMVAPPMGQESLAMGELNDSPPATVGNTNPQSHQQVAHSLRHNRLSSGPNQLVSRNSAGSVASYLSLLNSRYNLRLPRVGASLNNQPQ